MSESDKNEPLSLSGKTETLRLGLRTGRDAAPLRTGVGGRGKSVQVEVRRKRTITRVSQPADVSAETAAPGTAEPELEAVDESLDGKSTVDLSNTERAARARALEMASEVEADVLRQEEEVARRREEDDARRRRVQQEEDEQRQAEESAQRQSEAEKIAQAEVASAAAQPAPSGAARSAAPAPSEEQRLARQRNRATPRARGEQRRRSGKLTVTQVLNEDTNERVRSLASMRRQRARQLAAMKSSGEPPKKVVRDVVIPETITVADLANRMAERGADVIKALIGMDMMVNINQTIDADTAELVVGEFGHKVRRVSEADVEIGLEGIEDRAEDLLPRAPVVTVMGHVDHGKTSLLDALRNSDVVSGEAGGITQHIGAYQVDSGDSKITFIDTPGHEAFTAMRKRGAGVTDIIVLVVAADDGVMPQTVEAINHAKAAGAPIIVAVNKMDKANADLERVKQNLLQHEVVAEDFGGDVQMVPISALKKQGLDDLEEAILLQAELLELKANPSRPGEGVVVEAELDKGRGPVATVLVKRGALKTGDNFVVGAEFGRVRALIDSHGEQVSEAGPSVPVEVLGLNGTPRAGDEFYVVENEMRAREISGYRQRQMRESRVVSTGPASLEAMFSKIKEGKIKELPVVIKSDVQGSLEAIVNAAENLGNDEVAVQILHAAVGAITESDVTLASASDGFIVGFNVRANTQARDTAQRDGIDILYYSVIYELVDQLKSLLSGMLSPRIDDKVIANVSILEVFNVSKIGRIAGCRVTDGVVRRDARTRLLRDDIVIHDGPMRSLKRFKEDVREVREGNECGIALENFQDLRVGDVIEIYEREEVQRTL